MTEEMAKLVGGLNRAVGQALRSAEPSTNRLRKFGKVARRKLSEASSGVVDAGSALKLNPHPHRILPDGVFVCEPL
ncbi:MAG: hypothetical protein ACOY3Y_07415 [Acidobacteriota bacterium]